MDDNFYETTSNLESQISACRNLSEVKRQIDKLQHSLNILKKSTRLNKLTPEELDNRFSIIIKLNKLYKSAIEKPNTSANYHTEILRKEQDEHLIELSNLTTKLGDHAHLINNELSDQERLLDRLDDDMEITSSQLNFVLVKMSKIFGSNDPKTLKLILVLSLILLALFFVNVWTS